MMAAVVAPLDAWFGQMVLGTKWHGVRLMAVRAGRNFILIMGHIPMGVDLLAILQFEVCRRAAEFLEWAMTMEAPLGRGRQRGLQWRCDDGFRQSRAGGSR